MIEIGLVVSRWLQFAAAAILCGAPAFFLYGVRQLSAHDAGRGKRLVLGATLLGIVAAILMLLAQSAEMSGDAAAAFKPDVVWAVLSDTYFGAVWAVRFLLLFAMGALVVAVPAGRVCWMALTAVGALIAASLAWMGHGREGEAALGFVHLIADVLHVLAASVWIGALVVLLHSLRRAAQGGRDEIAAAAYGLSRLSGIGSLVVATLLVTGLVNAWALTAPHSISEAFTTDYARLLLVKVAVFVMMLALAALNRFTLSPRLAADAANERESKAAIVALRRNVLLETGLAVFVLVAVAALGVMEPPSAL
jgi:putative copper resistance protein D